MSEVFIRMRVKGGSLIHVLPPRGLIALCGFRPSPTVRNGQHPWRPAASGKACAACASHLAARTGPEKP